jgi:DNA replication ATP-dependent helicase Dna2
MTLPYDRPQTEECFLCSLDPVKRSCATARLEGRIIAAWERPGRGEPLPFVLLDDGQEFIALELTYYYRRLVRELCARGARARGLQLRVYHLPEAPQVGEYRGRRLLRYRAGPYTLAVLEPDTLLNITDLIYAEYCTRQYLLQRLIPAPPSPATVRGTLVHFCFKELLKEEAGRSPEGPKEGDGTGTPPERPLTMLRRYLARALEQSRLELALANMTPERLEAEVMPHLESLASWFEQQRPSLWEVPTEMAGTSASARAGGDAAEVAKPTAMDQGQGNQSLVRAETFLLAPEIGLKGRLDLLWQQGERRRLLELKTGGASGELPRSNHRWQVYGYHALLTVRRNASTRQALATLLYSGTPGAAQAFGIPFSLRELQRVNEQRNLLVVEHVTGEPAAPPGASRCARCALLDQCRLVSWLLDWQPPRPDEQAEETAASGPPAASLSEEDRAFFARYYRLLHSEGRAGEQQQALLWQTPVEEHIERGTAIGGLEPLEPPQPTAQGEWQQRFRCENTSELRSGDEILLCDGHPIGGEVVTGTIIDIGARHVTVWTPELIAHPTLIERHDTDVVHLRTLQNLLRWLRVEPRLRALVAGRLRPRFSAIPVQPRPDFNAEQNRAVTRALQMQDYLLIHGPPGTGKTAVIAEIVKRLCARGERVLLAAFTNQAVDNMLARLEVEGFHDYLRLGHERSVAQSVQQHLLKQLWAGRQRRSDGLGEEEELRALLRALPVVASTSATWSSEKYAPGEQEPEGGEPLLRFDVALIDEAGQLTVPALLGVLRLARRFILVGDEKQLPPLVLSREAAEGGLGESLFSILKRLDAAYLAEHPEAESACVALRTQYRMHAAIAAFASRTFYDGELRAHPSVASRGLTLAAPPRGRPTVVEALRPDRPLVFLNVSTPETAVRISHAEARLVRELVTTLLVSGVRPEEIGLIAPYRAQVANLRRHLAAAEPTGAPHPALTIDTVDRFQGGERAVIVISFATTQQPVAASLLADFLSDAHRLNVALTRAQRKLILVGHADALEDLPVFRELIAYCRTIDAFITDE